MKKSLTLKKVNPKLHWYSVKEELDSSSLYHSKVRECLLIKDFSILSIYQEVPLKDIVNTTLDLYLDFWIDTFGVAIEVQGEQHYKPVAYGNLSASEAIKRFGIQKRNDKAKRLLLEENGFHLMEIHYSEIKELSYDFLMERLKEIIKEI